MVTAKNDVFIFYWVELTFDGEGGMSRFLAGVGGLAPSLSREIPVYIYIYSIYIYILYILYIYVHKRTLPTGFYIQ